MKEKLLWMRCTSPELGKLAKQNAVVLIPVGAVEQHGPHMAVGCDSFLAEWTATRVAQGLWDKEIPAVVAPTLTVANSLHHMNFPGSMSLQPGTYMQVLKEWCGSIAAHGFRRIAIVNGHGGNRAPTNTVLMEINMELGVPVYFVDLSVAMKPTVGLESEKSILHSGEGETSLLLAYDETLVDPIYLETKGERRPRAAAEASGLVATFHRMETRTANGVSGNNSLATREKGEALMAAATARLVEALSEEALWAQPV